MIPNLRSDALMMRTYWWAAKEKLNRQRKSWDGSKQSKSLWRGCIKNIVMTTSLAGVMKFYLLRHRMTQTILET